MVNADVKTWLGPLSAEPKDEMSFLSNQVVLLFSLLVSIQKYVK